VTVRTVICSAGEVEGIKKVVKDDDWVGPVAKIYSEVVNSARSPITP
jgi:hypothetical protein